MTKILAFGSQHVLFTTHASSQGFCDPVIYCRLLARAMERIVGLGDNPPSFACQQRTCSADALLRLPPRTILPLASLCPQE